MSHSEAVTIVSDSQKRVDAMRRAAILLGSLAWCYPAASQVVDWRGAYIGGFAGAAFVDSTFATELPGEWSNPANPLNQIDRDAILPFLNSGIASTSAIGGAAVGYNWQVDGLLLGVEADYSALDGKSGKAAAVIAINPYRLEASTEVDWAATLRGRLGFAFDRSLVYVTSGLAVRELKFDQSIVQLNFPYVQTGASSSTKAGWVLGAGIEHALDDEWSLRLQYLHVDLGSASSGSAGVCPPPDTAACAVYTGSHKVELALDSVTAGINYRFGGP
jgi:outer membrane immunogenic protein